MANDYSLVQVVALCFGSGGIASIAVAYIASVPTIRQAKTARLQLDLENRKFDLEREKATEALILSLRGQVAEMRTHAEEWEERYRTTDQEFAMFRANCKARGDYCQRAVMPTAA